MPSASARACPCASGTRAGASGCAKAEARQLRESLGLACRGGLAADEHLDELRLDALRAIADAHRRGRQAGGAIDEVAQVGPPLRDHQGAVRVDRIAVVVRFRVVPYAAGL